MAHDFVADTFDTINGKHVVFAAAYPERMCEVFVLLDDRGEETDDPDKAEGGVAKIAEGCFTIFTWGVAGNA